jgi:hypothetical protein
MTTPSGVFRAIDAGTRALLLIVVGLVFMVGGVLLSAYAVEHPPLQKIELYAGLICAVFGALLLPGILAPTQKVLLFVQPFLQNIPVVGQMFGRRAGDVAPPVVVVPPPKPPTP